MMAQAAEATTCNMSLLSQAMQILAVDTSHTTHNKL